MLDVVVYHRSTGEEVERIACTGEHEANSVLRGIRINMSPDYRAAVMPHNAPDPLDDTLPLEDRTKGLWHD